MVPNSIFGCTQLPQGYPKVEGHSHPITTDETPNIPEPVPTTPKEDEHNTTNTLDTVAMDIITELVGTNSLNIPALNCPQKSPEANLPQSTSSPPNQEVSPLTMDSQETRDAMAMLQHYVENDFEVEDIPLQDEIADNQDIPNKAQNSPHSTPQALIQHSTHHTQHHKH